MGVAIIMSSTYQKYNGNLILSIFIAFSLRSCRTMSDTMEEREIKEMEEIILLNLKYVEDNTNLTALINSV